MSQPFSIRATWDSREALALLDPKNLAFAQARTLTRLAGQVKDAERETMKRVFDRPTPFTLNSLFTSRATPQRREARVWFKDPQRLTEDEHYLLPQVRSGGRPFKRFEKALFRAGLLDSNRELFPAMGASIDQHGNVSRGMYSRLMAQLQASPTGANETATSRRRNAKQKNTRRGGRFFYADIPGHGEGIWERFGFAFGSAVRPVFIAGRRARYTSRFDFFNIAERVLAERYADEFAHAYAETLRTARR